MDRDRGAAIAVIEHARRIERIAPVVTARSLGISKREALDRRPMAQVHLEFDVDAPSRCEMGGRGSMIPVQQDWWPAGGGVTRDQRPHVGIAYHLENTRNFCNKRRMLIVQCSVGNSINDGLDGPIIGEGLPGVMGDVVEFSEFPPR